MDEQPWEPTSVRQLCRVLSPRDVARLSGNPADEHLVERWATGHAVPSQEARQRLQLAFGAVWAISQHCHKEVVVELARPWFTDRDPFIRTAPIDLIANANPTDHYAVNKLLMSSVERMLDLHGLVHR